MREEGWGSAEGRGGENAMRAAAWEGATTLAGFRSSKSICFVTSEASGARKVQYCFHNVWGFWSSKSIMFYNVWGFWSSKNIVFIAFGASGAPKVLFL